MSRVPARKQSECAPPRCAIRVHQLSRSGPSYGRYTRLARQLGHPLGGQALASHLGYQAGALAGRYPATTVLNHVGGYAERTAG